MNHTEGHFEGAGGVHLYYQCWRPDGELRAALAIVHGMGEHSGRYPHVVDRLVPLGYAIYALDHRGHGRSPGKRGHINAWSEFREDVRALVQFVWSREPGRPFFLMGHSLGGLIVLDYTLHYPDSLLGVISSAPALAQTGVSPALIAISRVLSRITPGLTINTGLDAAGISRDPAVVQAYRDDPLVHGMASPRLGTELTRTMEWVMAHAGEWQVPLLMVHGGADPIVPAASSQAFFERVPVADKQRIEYEGGYHEPHNDIIHDQVTVDLTGWLDAHLPGGAG